VTTSWSPWRGCHRISEGCKFCYIHKSDSKYGRDTNKISRLKQLDAPIAKDKSGEYKMKSGQLVYTCFSTDFLIEEADIWRQECWDIIKARPDLNFMFLTKRIDRFEKCIPPDWNDGYDNVMVGCTVENQKNADHRLAIFSDLRIKHKYIILQPLLESVNIEKYLQGILSVNVGGESDRNARPLDYDWVLDIREQCIRNNVRFEFRQCGSNFIKDGKIYKLNAKHLYSFARKANIDC